MRYFFEESFLERALIKGIDDPKKGDKDDVYSNLEYISGRRTYFFSTEQNKKEDVPIIASSNSSK
jgi:hypothetical protein